MAKGDTGKRRSAPRSNSKRLTEAQQRVVQRQRESDERERRFAAGYSKLLRSYSELIPSIVGPSRVDFEHQTGIGRGTTRGWVKGRKRSLPGLENLYRIALLANVKGIPKGRLSLDWLAGFSVEPDREARAEIGDLARRFVSHLFDAYRANRELHGDLFSGLCAACDAKDLSFRTYEEARDAAASPGGMGIHWTAPDSKVHRVFYVADPQAALALAVGLVSQHADTFLGDHVTREYQQLGQHNQQLLDEIAALPPSANTDSIREKAAALLGYKTALDTNDSAAVAKAKRQMERVTRLATSTTP